MQEYYFGVPLSNSKSLCVGPITRDETATINVGFCDGLGYYLYVADAENPQGTEVLARFASEEAAFRMTAVLKRLSG